MPEPSRGEVWLVDLHPTRGHEQAGIRPGLVVSVDPFNHGPAGLVVFLPLTSIATRIPFHVEIPPLLLYFLPSAFPLAPETDLPSSSLTARA